MGLDILISTDKNIDRQGKRSNLSRIFLRLIFQKHDDNDDEIDQYSKISGVKLNYEIGPRRPGDVIATYANNNLAKQGLGWNPTYSLEDIMATAWKWEQRLKADETVFGSQYGELN